MLSKFCFFIAICILFVWISDFCGENSFVEENEGNRRALVRSKRYLVFPDGSSLQLVFCLQTSALIPIGDIFLYGNTLAIAWSLPTDPKLLLMFKEYERTAERRGDDKNMYYIKEGKILAKVPSKRKRSINKNMTFKEKLKIKIDRKKTHERKFKDNYLKKDHLHHDDIEFHRSSRVKIYEKIVPLISAVTTVTPVPSLGGDGRQCVLHQLCQAARISRQGTFLQELSRVIFTLTKGKEFEHENHREFEDAHRSNGDCALLYPGCDISIL